MIVFIADIHFGWQNFNKTFFKYQLNYFQNELFPYLIENNVKNVICLGDLVHHRELIDIYMQQQLDEHFYSFFEENNINFHYLIGNHDLYYKSTNDVSYAYTINYDKFHIVDKPDILNIDGINIGLVPWGNEDKMPSPYAVDMLCGHFEISGFLNNSGNDNGSRLKISDFSEYPIVYSGHYHIQDKKSNIQYLGSPYQMRRDDFGTPKGFWYYDGEMKFKANETSPKFIKVIYDEIGDETTISVDDGLDMAFDTTDMQHAISQIGNNFVDVVVNKATNKTDLEHFISDIPNYKRSKYVEMLEDFTKEVENIDEDADNLELCMYYIDNLTFEDDIEKEYIKTRISTLYDNAKQDIGE